MKDNYKVTNLEPTVQRIYDEQGRGLWLAQGESAVMTNPPSSPSFKVEKLSELSITEKITLNHDDLMGILEAFVYEKKTLTYKEWKDLAKTYNYDEKALELYNKVGGFTLNGKRFSKSDLEQLKNEQTNNDKEVKI